MRFLSRSSVIACAATLLLGSAAAPQSAQKPAPGLDQSFDLAGPRDRAPRSYRQETWIQQYTNDGTRGAREYYVLDLDYRPDPAGERYTCVRFAYRLGESAETTIPSLEGYSYVIPEDPAKVSPPGGPIFGLDQEKFRAMKDASGRPVPLGAGFAVFNGFVDFHSFFDVFGRPTAARQGIQDLHRVGDRIVHDAANSNPPVSQLGAFAEGSTFTNGEITMELKGLGAVGGAPCAIVGYDSGESSFKMLMEAMPNARVDTVGTSHYFGDIWIDLASRWPRRVELTEYVVSATTMGGKKVASNAIERTLRIGERAPAR